MKASVHSGFLLYFAFIGYELQTDTDRERYVDIQRDKQPETQAGCVLCCIAPADRQTKWCQAD